MSKISTRFTMVAGCVTAAVGLLAVFAGGAAADTVSPIGFGSPYVAGQNINGQQGWSNTGLYDANVVNTPLYGFGQALQISNAKVSGSFGDQTFSPGLSNPAGETTGFSHFDASFKIGTTRPTYQNGLHISVSPDNGQGGRMSYLRFEDNTNGVDVYFDDVNGVTNGTANFTNTKIATLSRTSAHTIRFLINFKTGAGSGTESGPGNTSDDVKIYIDGKKVASGTTWEDYYRYDNEGQGGVTPPAVSKLLFRAAGDAASIPAGQGFLIDDVTLSSS